MPPAGAPIPRIREAIPPAVEPFKVLLRLQATCVIEPAGAAIRCSREAIPPTNQQQHNSQKKKKKVMCLEA
jgi:hypothetical protein